MIDTVRPQGSAIDSWNPPGPGPWKQDQAHFPHAATAILQEIYPSRIKAGFAEAMAPFGLLLDCVNQVCVNGFPYMQPQPFDAPGPDGPPSHEFIVAEIGRRTALAASAMENKIWRDAMKHWDSEAKPASIALHRSMSCVALSRLTDAELRSYLHECIEHLGNMWNQHHRFNCMAMVPVGDFVLHAAQWTQRPPFPLFAVFDGWSAVSGIVNPEIEPAVAALKADEPARILLEGAEPAAARLGKLRELLPSVDEYVKAVGHRIAVGFDLTNPTIGERPDLVLGRLSAALQHGTDESKSRAEALARELRSATPHEHHQEFDALLAEARYVYRLRDERGLYSDSSAVGLLRLALIELGSRLHARGRIGFTYDALDLQVVEIDAIFEGSTSPTAADLTERVALRKARSAAGAPPLLGPTPPPPPPLDQLPPALARVMGAFGFMLNGVLGEADAPGGDHDTVLGIAGSGGIYEGPAHIVRNFDDLLGLEDGDVLVTTATGESFNSFLHVVGAIVTDHGSFASHAAIMGREMGFPAVVGTVDATKRISNGQRVRVDGTTGTVTILS